MVQGCTSDAGKSTVVAGLCRIFKQRGINVAPFKPQNMALNSAVTENGGEIGRAQAVQAQACGLAPHTDMNPVLLKPNSDTGAQVIIHGKALQDMNATTYHRYKTVAMDAVLQSHQRLSSQYDCVLVEGAGSPAEINLRDRDIANMGFAEAVDCPVILVADIDRGGVFAHFVGTLELLSKTEQARVQGFIINRFRGDIALLHSGLDWLEEKTGKPVLGVIPYLKGLHLEAEDGINKNIDTPESEQNLPQDNRIKVIVPVLPRISNHTDFDVLRLHPQVDFEFIDLGQPIPAADIIILPGSKSVRSDLQQLKRSGWFEHTQQHLRYGGKVIGICGGFQMLGTQIHDPDGIEGQAGSESGFGVLNFSTTLEKEKQLKQSSGQLLLATGGKVKGYEIHAGVSSGKALNNALIELDSGEKEGVISDDNAILGTYFHGLFDEAEARNTLLEWMGIESVQPVDYHRFVEHELDRLATEMERALDIDKILAM